MYWIGYLWYIAQFIFDSYTNFEKEKKIKVAFLRNLRGSLITLNVFSYVIKRVLISKSLCGKILL